MSLTFIKHCVFQGNIIVVFKFRIHIFEFTQERRLAVTRCCFTSRRLLTNQSSFHCPSHLHCPLYCNTIARLLRNIRCPPDPPRVRHTQYNIDNGKSCKGQSVGPLAAAALGLGLTRVTLHTRSSSCLCVCVTMHLSMYPSIYLSIDQSI